MGSGVKADAVGVQLVLETGKALSQYAILAS